MGQRHFILFFFLVLVSVTKIYSQTSFIVKGKVVSDIDGEELIGAHVIIKGESIGTVTDIDGNFTLQVRSDKTTLVFSMIGFENEEVLADKNFMLVELSETGELLSDIVVVGYGTQKKETITGAITSVSNRELIKSPVTNVSNALAGRLSGVTTVQRSGEPGRDQSEIRIRGVSTLNSSQSTPLIVIDGVERASLDGIDINEIESINVLKDASATAVYGIRGANGVIILTTKIGKESKPIVHVSLNSGVQTPTQLPDFLDSYEFALLRNEGMRNDGLEPLFSKEILDKFQHKTDPIFFPTENLYKRLLKDYANRQQYNINIGGGTNKVRYFISMGYIFQEGIYNTNPIKKLNVGYDPNPEYRRYNLRSNFDFNFTNNLSGSIKLGGQFTNSNYPNTSTATLFSTILNSPPFIGYGIHDNKLIRGYLDDPLSFQAGRGLSTESVLLNTGYADILENTININLGLNYIFKKIKGLSARTMFAYDHYYSRSAIRNRALDTYYAVKDINDNLVLTQNNFEGGFDTFSENHGVYRVSYFEAALDYSRKLGDHRISGLLLYNQRKRKTPGLEYSVPESLMGVVGRTTYSYADKYLAEFNLGYNGSENFAPQNRFGFFPAISLGWVPSEETFYPENDIVNWMKIRGSYGIVGNDKIGGNRFLYLPTSYSYGGNVYQFGTEGIDRENYASASEERIGNPYVTWEKAMKSNIGADIHFLKSKLILNIDYFFEKRGNILITRSTIPEIVGATDLPAVNLGRVENKGFEFEAHWKGGTKKLSYSIDGNISFAKNKVIFRDEPDEDYDWMMATDFSVGQLKGYKTDGLFNTVEELENRPYYSFYANKVQLGDIKYIDINGDGIIDRKDMVPIGFSSYPEIVFGCNFGLNWNNFDASILLQGATRTSIQQRVMTAWAFHNGANMTLKEHLNRWTPERYATGELITMPRLSSDGNNSPNSQTSDYWLEDASYLRLKNIEIGYTISSPKLAAIGISDTRFFINGNNILTLTRLKNADPENPTTNTGSIYPQMKVFNFGLNFKF